MKPFARMNLFSVALHMWILVSFLALAAGTMKGAKQWE